MDNPREVFRLVFDAIDVFMSTVLILKSINIVVRYLFGEITFVRPWYIDFRYPLFSNNRGFRPTQTWLFFIIAFIFGFTKSFRNKLTILVLIMQMWLNFLLYRPFQEIDEPHRHLICVVFRFNKMFYLSIIECTLFAKLKSEDTFNSLTILLGLALYMIGFALKYHYDNHFLNLRDESEFLSPSEGYLFHYITCPHLFSRSVEWLGIAILSGNHVIYSYALFISCFHYVNAQSWHRSFVIRNIAPIHGRNAFFPGSYHGGDFD